MGVDRSHSSIGPSKAPITALQNQLSSHPAKLDLMQPKAILVEASLKSVRSQLSTSPVNISAAETKCDHNPTQVDGEAQKF